MTERLSTTTEAPKVDDETIAEINSAETDAAPEEVDPSVARLTEARDRARQLLDDYEASKTDDAEPDAPEVREPAAPSPEKKDTEKTRNFFRKIGKWAVTSLEANGWIPRRGTWHKRDGISGFIAKSYVWSKNRKAKRTEGFLSAEASQQLNGEAETAESEPAQPDAAHESDADDHEDESKAKRVRRRIGRVALSALRKAGRAPKTAFRTWKEIKNTK